MKFFTYGNPCALKRAWSISWLKGLDPAIKRTIIMRINLVACLISITIMNVCASVRAQSISLSFKQAALTEVLATIKKQSGYQFLYNNSEIKRAKDVSVTIKNATLKDALDQVFKDQPLSYQILDKTIVIKEKTEKQKEENNSKSAARDITGTVTDEKGEPLVGATVAVKGTNQYAMTNSVGAFVLNGINENVVLRISFIGFETREVRAKENITISLTRKISDLDEVQVIAYGTTTQRLNTGSVSTVKAADIESQPVSNPLAALQGRVPGMVITQTSGVAGSSFKVQIRGQSSLDPALSQNNPLFIIDGVPFEAGITATNRVSSAANNPTSISTGGLSPLNLINPQDIESIDVLKDADATSIYGSRGANGVILITTKKGKTGATRVNVNSYFGYNKVGRTMDILNTEQYIAMRKEGIANDGFTLSANPLNQGYAPDIMLWDASRYTDFKDLLIGNNAYSQNLQASVSGGNNLTQFLVGAGYHRETTVYSKKFSDNITSFNFSINHKTADQKFNIQFSGMYSNDKNKLPAYDMTRYLNSPPNLRLYDDAGNLSWDEAGVSYWSLGHTNPLSFLEEKYESINENLNGNLNLSYSLLPGLVARANLGYNVFRTDESSAKPKVSIDPNVSQLPSAYFANSVNRSWIIEPQLEYNLTGSRGKLNILLGNTLQDKSGSSNLMSGLNYSSDLLLNSIAAAGTINASNDRAVYRYTALFGRINYNYLDRYIINLTGRRDGSSRFGPKQRWANFGAIGAAWVFSNESFIKEAVPFLSYGKIRTSYGSTGNDQIGDYKYLNLWSSTTNNYNGLSGLFPRSLYNPNFNWERSRKFEAALELGLLKDAVFLSGAYYNNRSDNQLINYVLASQTGFGNVVRNFPGLVENSGIEVLVRTKNISTANLKWTTSLNITVPRNKLISFPNIAATSYNNTYVEGKSLSVIRGYRFLGVDPQTGIYAYEDFNGDGQLTRAADFQVFGNRDPKFYGGLQNNISYKGFDVTFFFQFTKQTGSNYIQQLSDAAPGQIYNQPEIVLHRWQKPGDNSEIQKFTSIASSVSGALGNLNLSNGRYTDASFIKLKNVSFSYGLPKDWLNRYRIGGCRLYVELQNLLTITGYKGADPEVQDFYVLPPLRTMVAGIQINL
ncbi:SusC/RagA family TonB-linked outer membrane protein [Pedobacter sp. ISL-68]|uniref:SusC/RagA family TonB-linked outer membrane protein n=1 Tax=unclassified Pedobacter TaxID=2628915 RepID=UPI001BE7B3B5|nr:MULTISPECIES: SusC/RagA family TonB-linked outer membrane protein [unclassified Pedobacter]MBT2561317.1 SusC/RagA family TonB-linked outer membrane protein [Pedobacter sp. ISL-64]MBT2590706.1 SusC/RagA family TonB-linked outer membrane protein [Pedobacter sp. ISL-68]